MVEPQQAAAQASVPPQANAPPLAPQTFEDFFRASFREVVRTAMSAGAGPEEAKDAASKALLEMYPKWPVPDNPLAYARKAAFTNFIKAKERRDSRTARRLIDYGHVPRQEGAEDARLTAWEDEQWVADVLSAPPCATSSPATRPSPRSPACSARPGAPTEPGRRILQLPGPDQLLSVVLSAGRPSLKLDVWLDQSGPASEQPGTGPA